MVTLEVSHETADGGRTGRLRTPHGEVATPAFMPVGTFGTVRGLMPSQLEGEGVEILLANSYHLALRPGVETIAKLGGLHRFMSWDRPILTDSGGYQVFSLAPLVAVDEDGATFRSHFDGARVRMTPEISVGIQCDLGVDVGMVFDVVTATPGDRDAAARASERTLRWSRRAKDALTAKYGSGATSIFGIMQGGLFTDLRRSNAQELTEIDFPGYAVGGLSVGEAREQTMETARESVVLLPRTRPRYMMGMGTPEDLVELCRWGYDLFDCVIPTRNGRNSTVFSDEGDFSLRNAVNADRSDPIDASCGCLACRSFSRGYLHHMAKRREMLAAVLASIHNIRYYQRLMARIRAALGADRYEQFQAEFRASRERGD